MYVQSAGTVGAGGAGVGGSAATGNVNGGYNTGSVGGNGYGGTGVDNSVGRHLLRHVPRPVRQVPLLPRFSKLFKKMSMSLLSSPALLCACDLAISWVVILYAQCLLQHGHHRFLPMHAC